jgi:hypothetical protein
MPNPILIAVPPHLVPAVTAIIANDGAISDGESSVEDALLHGWTAEMLRQHYRDSSEKMRDFLALLARSADQEITSDEAAGALGYPDWNSIAGMLGAAQRRARNHFGRDHGPWYRRWTPDGRARLKMPKRVATVILDEATAQGDLT